MKASCHRYILQFKQASGTSRGILTEKETWFIILQDQERTGIGECGILRTLSYDDRPDYEDKLSWVCEHIELGEEKLYDELEEFPSIRFGLEQAFLSLRSIDCFQLFPSEFTSGQSAIPINGLIWMGKADFMERQIREKLNSGFDCIKLKIGAIDFETELHLISSIRKKFSPDDIEIRVDANGAFGADVVMSRLEALSKYHLHSIEQPVKAGNPELMCKVCANTPLPVALDEELIGVQTVTKRRDLLQMIKPQYIILKPSLVGGYRDSEEWIRLAEAVGAGWWITSALESNIGLNAIAQWTYTLNSDMPQGLGTGGLYTNNIEAPLVVQEGFLRINPGRNWNIDSVLKKIAKN
ncbi:o-succinylbenzoate synthase [Robertkochia solimangrovi]|uniref:o-succinylbenzoate synthase n=1 Tax=Robertkochia solimangrovi TaxID=2213046 RepID=UPI00117E0C8C|nr:o-succinylbenzoate synthase [Robertkochia solimangrovi]TRZ45401.1 o-succinylbenzoate synthase [Robertkochia solimangrovi]